MTPRLRSFIGLLILAGLLAIMVLCIVERCENQLKDLDPTLEEMVEAGRGK